jgi:SAM-dependent methyltransferase
MARVEGLGSDPEYLRDTQYKDPSNLQARIALVAKHTQAAEPWYPWLATRFEWPEDADVLEVGCGPGLFWVHIAELLPRIHLTLTDLSDGMVATAAAAVTAVPNVEVTGARACDARELPFADASFDVAVANHMLYHVPEPADAAQELARVLQPDGVLLASTNSRHLEAVADIQAEVYGTSTRDLVQRRFGSDTGGAVLREAFDSVQWHEHPGELACAEPDDVYAFIASTAIAQESDPAKLTTVRGVIARHFEAGGGTLRTPVDSGCFVACRPRAR